MKLIHIITRWRKALLTLTEAAHAASMVHSTAADIEAGRNTTSVSSYKHGVIKALKASRQRAADHIAAVDEALAEIENG